MVLEDVAAALGHDTGHHHAAQAPEDAGDIACHEQGGNGHGASHGGVDYHNVAGGDHHAGRAGGNVADGYVFVGVSLFLLKRSKDAAHCHGSGNAGTGHGTEKHVCNDVGLSQRTGETVCNQLSAANQTAGYSAEVHQVTGQHKEGDGQQRERVYALEHLLGGDHHGAYVGHYDDHAGSRAKTYAQADWETNCKGDENDADHYDAGKSCYCHVSLPPITRFRRARRRRYGCPLCSF